MNLLHNNGNIGLKKIWNIVRSIRSDLLYQIWEKNKGLYDGKCSSENLGKQSKKCDFFRGPKLERCADKMRGNFA